MEKISDLISKKVISVDEGDLVGYVLDGVFEKDLKTFHGLIVVDEESENTFLLDRKSILSTGQDCVMITSSRDLEFSISSCTNNPVGKEVYDRCGTMMGRVLDVEMSGKSVKRILTNKCEFPVKYVRKAGDNFIIFGLPQKEKKKKARVFDAKVQSMPRVVIASKVAGKSDEQNRRIYANPKSLIGRIMANDLFGFNNEIIAKKNEKINENIINKAKMHNKLNILNFYSK